MQQKFFSGNRRKLEYKHGNCLEKSPLLSTKKSYIKHILLTRLQLWGMEGGKQRDGEKKIGKTRKKERKKTLNNDSDCFYPSLLNTR